MLSDAKSSMVAEVNSAQDTAAAVTYDCMQFSVLQHTVLHQMRSTLLRAIQKVASVFYSRIMLRFKEFEYILSNSLEGYCNVTLGCYANSNGTNTSDWAHEMEFIEAANKTIWVYLVQLRPLIAVTDDTVIPEFYQVLRNLTMVPEYKLDEDLMAPLLTYSRVMCDWCMTSSTTPSVPGCAWCSTYDTPLTSILADSLEVRGG